MAPTWRWTPSVGSEARAPICARLRPLRVAPERRSCGSRPALLPRTKSSTPGPVERAAATAPDDRSLSALRDGAHAMSHRDWLRLDARRRSAAGWAALLKELDVVLCPVSPVAAVRHEPEPEEVDSVDRRLARTIDVDGREQAYLDQIMWNVVVGMARLTATVAPVGRTADGLPVGA